jgi:DNA-directed RNA polymerase specialized sigma24 family protein/predicted Ser/Thr protein kinase
LDAATRRRLDPEDVVQSAYRSFFLRAAEGDFELRQPGDLWRLLAQITLNKVRKQAERHKAARRDCRRDDADGLALLNATDGATPDEIAALDEQISLVSERLSADDRLALADYLQGATIEEIAERLSRSPRTVRRALSRVRSLLERQLLSTVERGTTELVEAPPLENPLPYSDFRLERLVGAGGMGKVYRAKQHSTGQLVAIKALHKCRQTDSRSVRQFLHEAAVVQRLDHPGIVSCRGLGRFPAGGYFIVMEYIEGENLQTRVDRGRLPAKQAIDVMADVAEAIGHAHALGVIHCDLKPANLLIRTNGAVVVTDFGFAHIATQAEGNSAHGGTRGYLAPELWRSGARPTPAADVYSLGRILQHIAIDLPANLRTLCEQCESTDPTDRPSSAQDFQRRLLLAN